MAVTRTRQAPWCPMYIGFSHDTGYTDQALLGAAITPMILPGSGLNSFVLEYSHRTDRGILIR